MSRSWRRVPRRALRFDRHELAGSIGDIGVMLPLAVGVSATAGLSLVSIFLCVAATYILSALAFRVPLPVQPMKAMGATIVALGLSAPVVGAASIEIAVLLLLLAFTPVMRYLARLFPRAVLRGIQLSVGLLLLKGALLTANGATAMPGFDAAVTVGARRLSIGLAVAVIVALALFAGLRRRRLPASLLVVGLGAAGGLALVVAGVSELAVTPAASAALPAYVPSLHDAWIALVFLVLPQLPLSLGNSVYATEDVMRDYYGDGAGRVTARGLLVSLGIVNLVGGAAGGMPLCHGSGGATAHYRLGARTGGATILAGLLFAALAAAAALGVSPLLVPGSVLAGMLLFVGIQHCLLITDLVTVDEVLCALLVAAIAVVAGNLAVGFVVGWAVYMLALKGSPLQSVVLRWPRYIETMARRSSREEFEIG